jgi:large subunit ribosomal protein L23
MGWLKKMLKKEDDEKGQKKIYGQNEKNETEKQPKVKVTKKQVAEDVGEKKEETKKEKKQIKQSEKKSVIKMEEKSFPTASATKKKSKLTGNSIVHKVLLGPLVTEKSAISESSGKYSFVTARWATKTQVKRAIFDLYGEKAIAVNIMNIDGRQLNFKRKPGRRSDYKKAIVTLKKGVSINIHAGV